MSTDHGNISPGVTLGAATFATVVLLRIDTPFALWATMAGLSGLAIVLTVRTAGAGNLLGVLSLAIAAVIAVSAIAGFAAPVAGVEIANHPWRFDLFAAVLVGFPLGVMAASDPFLPPLPAVLAGICGVIYLPLSLWLSIRLGLNAYMINVFDPRLQLGHHLGMQDSSIGLAADLLGMSIAGGITLVILSLPALPLVLLVRAIAARS